jgi:hypothetical protein
MPLSDFRRAPANADVVVEPDSDPAAWISSKWLKEAGSEADRAKIREWCLALANAPADSVLNAQESVEAFPAYLLAVLPNELTTAFLRSTGRAIGCSTAQGIAVLSLRDDRLFTAGSTTVLSLLNGWAGEWRSSGCPGYEQLVPTAERGSDGWIIRARLRAYPSD